MKTKQIIISVATVAIIAGFTTFAFGDEEKEDAISMDKVPAKVKETLAKYAAVSEVKQVEKSDMDGKKVFEFDIEQGTHKFEISISKKGKYLGAEEDVALSTLPDAAQKALNDLAGSGGKVSGTEKATDADNKVTYEADITKDGKKFEVVVDADGKVIKNESTKDKEDKD